MASGSSDFDAQQLRLLMRRLTDDESFFTELGFHFSYYMQRVAKLRNNGDSINMTLKSFLDRDDASVAELKRCLEFFRKSSASLQDYRDAEVLRLEERVVKPLCSYAAQFKRVRSQLTSANSAKQKQLKEAAKLGGQLRRSNSQASASGGLGTSQQSSTSINSAKSAPDQESNPSGSTAAATEGLLKDRKLLDELRSFEQRKLDDLKSALLEFLKIEILSTSKQLELLTGMFNSLNEYDTKIDLASFCKVVLKQEALEMTDPKKERSAARKGNKKQSQEKSQPQSTSSRAPKKTEEAVYSVVQKAPSGSRNSANKKDDHQYEEVGNTQNDDEEDSTWDDEDELEEEEVEEEEEQQQRQPSTSKAPSKNAAPPKPALPSTRSYENTPVANKQRATASAQPPQKGTDQQEESDEEFDSEDELSLTPRNAQTNRTMLSSKSVSFAT